MDALRRHAADAARFAGLAIGAFVLLNVAGELVRPPFETLGHSRSPKRD